MNTKKKTMNFKKLLAVAALMSMAISAQAIMCDTTAMHPCNGTNVNYTFDTANLNLYTGSYDITGDTLSFLPTGFVNDGATLVTSTINVTVTTHLGQQFSALSFLESGQYTQTPSGGVNVSGQLIIFDPLSPSSPLLPPIIADSPFTNGTASWQATINQNLASVALASSLNVTIQNILIAYDSDSIRKNLVQLTVMTTPVPEAETWIMMLVGLGIVALQLRRRTDRKIHAI